VVSQTIDDLTQKVDIFVPCDIELDSVTERLDKISPQNSVSIGFGSYKPFSVEKCSHDGMLTILCKENDEPYLRSAILGYLRNSK
jgi:hypothetical protein